MRTRGTSSGLTWRRSNNAIPRRFTPCAMGLMANIATASAGIERARRRLAAGDLATARSEAEAIVGGAAGSEERCAAHLVLAVCCDKAGDAAAALEHTRAAVDSAPGDPVAYYAHAEQQEASGDKAGALASLRRAIEIEPRFARALRYLGILLGETGDAEGAIAALEDALLIEPNHSRAWNNLGNAQRTLGQLAEAERSFARALALQPDYALAAANLGEVLRDQGEVERAETTLRAALARQAGGPPFRAQIVLLAGLLRERGALDEAERLYRQAIDLSPHESGGQWASLAWVLSERGAMAAARDAYAAARTVDATDLRSLLGKHLTLPMIYADTDHLAAERAGFAAGLSALQHELPAAAAALSEEKLLDGFRWTNFFLAYQGQDDRALQAAYASLVAQAIDAGASRWRRRIEARPVTGPRLRVGFASAFFHVGTCGRYFRSWITDLDRKRFEVFVYHLYPGMDEIASAIAQRADCFRTFAGLPEDRKLLLCPQSLWKIHPDNDALFAEILAANPDALLVLFEGRYPAVGEQFMRRLTRALGEHGVSVPERIHVLPQVGHDDYLRINLVCDAMLDTMHWSGGNTSLDALACGLPMVTLPGAFMRGRQSAGMLQLLGIAELIARDRADYLAIAARLCRDPAWRVDLSRRIRAGQARLFDVRDAIASLETLIQTGALPA